MPSLQVGIAAAKAGDKDQAREILQALLSHDPKNEEAWWWLASVLEQEDAIICLKNVLKLNPSNQKAQVALSELRAGHSTPAGAPYDIPQPGGPDLPNADEEITEYSASVHRKREELKAWIEYADYLYQKGQSLPQMRASLRMKGLGQDYVALVLKHFFTQHRKVAQKKMVRGAAGCVGGLLVGLILFLTLLLFTGNVVVLRIAMLAVGGTILLGGAFFLGGLFQFLKAFWLE